MVLSTFPLLCNHHHYPSSEKPDIFSNWILYHSTITSFPWKSLFLTWFSQLARTTGSQSCDQTPTLIPNRDLSGDSHLASCQGLLHRKCLHPRGSSGCSDNLDGAVRLPLHPADPAFMFQCWFTNPQTAGAPHSHGWFVRLFREVYFCKGHVICEAYGRREL